MKKLLLLGLFLGLVGCDQGLTEREKQCLQFTGNIKCQSQVDEKVRLLNAQEGLIGENGLYQKPTNFYGDPRYGYWNDQGGFQFYNQNSPEALSTNSFLLGAGLGGLAAYALTRDGRDSNRYRSKYKSHYSNPKYSRKDYINQQKLRSKDREIQRLKSQNAKKEQQRRKLQSERDKLKNQQNKKVVNKTKIVNKKPLLKKKPVYNKARSYNKSPVVRKTRKSNTRKRRK